MTERGTEDGQRDEPPTEATRLSEPEQQVVSRVEGALAQHAKETMGVGGAKDFTTLPEDLEALSAEPQTILTQFRAKKARAVGAVEIELEAAQTDYERAYRDYRSFRKLHGLTETEPSYDTVFWRKVFWLALLFTVEVAANGWMIGQASQGGLVQGWTTALMISVLVVLTGTLIGVGPWRYMNYGGADGSGRVHRLWAVPAVVLGVALLTFFALYVAHYRYQLSIAPLDAPVPDHILSNIAANPFEPFQQLESMVLFIVAMLIGIFAIARGVHWDDPYPGYGPRHRRMEEARERARSLALGLSHNVDQAKEAADGQMAEVSEKVHGTIGSLKGALGRAQDNAGSWDQISADILSAGREAILRYRRANRAARGVKAPDYFQYDPFTSFSTSPESGASLISGLESALSRATANITLCKSQLAGARAQLEAEYQSFYDDEMAPFLKGVQDGAATRVKDEFADPEAKAKPARKLLIDEEPEIVPLKRSGTLS